MKYKALHRRGAEAQRTQRFAEEYKQIFGDYLSLTRLLCALCASAVN